MQQTGSTGLIYPPITLDLVYLIIPYKGKDPTEDDRVIELMMMGKIIQKFYDNAIITGSVLKGSLAGSTGELHLLLNPISLDDLNKIWTSFTDVPYRLMISYMVTPVSIESARSLEVKRVTEKEDRYDTMETDV